jgi:hypothetical protein
MIFKYGFTVPGPKHIEEGDPCQDAHKITTLKNGWVVAAVADGVGSAAHSDVSAKLAVDNVTATVAGLMPDQWNVKSIMALLHTGFIVAQKEIEKEAKRQNRTLDYYDTTLTAVVYDGRQIVFGHVGDSGVLGLGSFGDYVTVTQVQKGKSANEVMPLRAGPDYWVFDYSEEEFSSILLWTDGLWQMFYPSKLRGGIYINFARQFMDANYIGLTNANHEEVRKAFEDRINGDDLIFEPDDKTIIGLINCELFPQLKEPAYYDEPPWTKMKEDQVRGLYGDIYHEIVKVDTEEESLIPDKDVAESVESAKPNLTDDLIAEECKAGVDLNQTAKTSNDNLKASADSDECKEINEKDETDKKTNTVFCANEEKTGSRPKIVGKQSKVGLFERARKFYENHKIIMRKKALTITKRQKNKTNRKIKL